MDIIRTPWLSALAVFPAAILLLAPWWSPRYRILFLPKEAHEKTHTNLLILWTCNFWRSVSTTALSSLPTTCSGYSRIEIFYFYSYYSTVVSHTAHVKPALPLTSRNDEPRPVFNEYYSDSNSSILDDHISIDIRFWFRLLRFIFLDSKTFRRRSAKFQEMAAKKSTFKAVSLAKLCKKFRALSRPYRPPLLEEREQDGVRAEKIVIYYVRTAPVCKISRRSASKV